jgi:hypothetical protein
MRTLDGWDYILLAVSCLALWGALFVYVRDARRRLDAWVERSMEELEDLPEWWDEKGGAKRQ